MPHTFFDVDRPIVIGHRGAAGDRPENTLLSFEAALAQGAQILESDIHISRDGVPILLHDPTLERTTDGHGDASQASWAELSALDAGIRFKDVNGTTPFRGKGVRIPSLEQAFERFPDAYFNLEIKSPGQDTIRSTLDLVERFERADRTLLAAGEDAIMRALRAALATRSLQPAVGASLGEIVAAISSAIDGCAMPTGVMALQIPSTFGGKPLATREFVDHAHRHDVQVHVWTINELSEIEALLDLGVDGIVTDHPGRMADWLQRVGRR
jgi:glycerophosphoryl diester phosphodiesterase